MTAQTIHYHKELRTSGAASQAFGANNSETSLWQYEGEPCHGSVPPTTAANPDNTTDGSLKHVSPGVGLSTWLHALIAIPPVAGRMVVYDRLAHISGLSGTVTTAQTTSMSVSRWGPSYAGVYIDPAAVTGEGNEIFLEVYTQIGATATTVTASYTNDAGTSGRTTQAVTFGGTGRREADRVIRLALQAGDVGVRSVESVTVLATTGTAGNFGCVIGRRIAEFTSYSFTPELFAPTFDEGGPVEVLPGACIAVTHAPVAAAAQTWQCVDAFFTLVDN